MMQTSGTMTKPILAKLYAILNEEFTKKGDPRCLIFVQTRACARNLSDHLKKVKELPMFYKKENVSFMVSTNQSSYSCGQTSREQQVFLIKLLQIFHTVKNFVFF
jgi:ERCC4-related helicase